MKRLSIMVYNMVLLACLGLFFFTGVVFPMGINSQKDEQEGETLKLVMEREAIYYGIPMGELIPNL